MILFADCQILIKSILKQDAILKSSVQTVTKRLMICTMRGWFGKLV